MSTGMNCGFSFWDQPRIMYTIRAAAAMRPWDPRPCSLILMIILVLMTSQAMGLSLATERLGPTDFEESYTAESDSEASLAGAAVLIPPMAELSELLFVTLQPNEVRQAGSRIIR